MRIHKVLRDNLTGKQVTLKEVGEAMTEAEIYECIVKNARDVLEYQTEEEMNKLGKAIEVLEAFEKAVKLK